MKSIESFATRFLTFATILTLAASLSGCGGGVDDAYTGPTGTVTGTVKIDDQPVSSTCAISFVNLEKGFTASARTDSSGNYTLKSKDSENIPVGKYSVTVSLADSGAAEPSPEEAMEQAMAQQESGGEVAPPASGVIPAKYASPGSSGLSFEVKEGANTIDIPLSSK